MHHFYAEESSIDLRIEEMRNRNKTISHEHDTIQAVEMCHNQMYSENSVPLSRADKFMILHSSAT